MEFSNEAKSDYHSISGSPLNHGYLRTTYMKFQPLIPTKQLSSSKVLLYYTYTKPTLPISSVHFSYQYMRESFFAERIFTIYWNAHMYSSHIYIMSI